MNETNEHENDMNDAYLEDMAIEMK